MNVFITKALEREQRTVRLTGLKSLLWEKSNLAHRTSGLGKTSLGLRESPALHPRGKIENKMELKKRNVLQTSAWKITWSLVQPYIINIHCLYVLGYVLVTECEIRLCIDLHEVLVHHLSPVS